MLTQSQILSAIESTHVVVGMRGAFPPDVALNVTNVMLKYDFNIVEFMMNSEKPIEAAKAVKAEYGDDVIVAMGTCLSLDDVKRVQDSGAVDFFVSPAFQPDIVQYLLDDDIFVAPGVQTPSECVMAWEIGVPLLKLFPIGALGIEYFKAVYGPLKHMKFMCNGATNAENAQQFLSHGASAIGMGGWLSGDGRWTDERLHERAKLTRKAVDIATGHYPLQEA